MLVRNEAYSELLSTDPLSKCLQRVSYAVERNGSQELKNWLRLELAGYFSSNKAHGENTKVPEYRIVVGQHVDLYGRVLSLRPQLSFVNEMRLREGVEELEGWAGSRDTVTLHDPLMCELIRERLQVDVHYFRFSASSLAGVFSAIRTELAERLADLSPAQLKLTQPSPAKEEIIHIRPNIYGLGIDLRALWRRYWRS